MWHIARGVVIAALSFGVAATGSPAAADDPNAVALTKLFIDVCVPNMSNPAGVRAWAEAHSLPRVEDPKWVDAFVGAGNPGGAWVTQIGGSHFAISNWGPTQACAVWAQAADPSDVESNFRRLIMGIPGLTPRVDADRTIQPDQPGGRSLRQLAYNIRAPGANSSYEFLMLTTERPGGVFQASLKVSRATAN
jgi:hypothetical protein